MALKAVVFDVGETLVDETKAWEHVAELCSVPAFTLIALVGVTIARGESHRRAFEWLGIEHVPARPAKGTLYPDAEPCLRRLRERGLRVGAAGNMRAVQEELVQPHVDFVTSSERLGVEKPAVEFFDRIRELAGCAAAEIAYVGDRVDNDVEPALAAGMHAVHIRRGPWGHLHEPPPGAVRIESLAQLPELV
jgi:HAD superfamily hydrolase (TIGR01549 family)